MNVFGLVRYGITVLAGAIIPLIVLLALFLAGEPPAIIAAWERGEVRVTAHETVIRDTGFGIVEHIEVSATGPGGETRLLRIADDPSGTGAARLFPVGSVVLARLSPGGNLAWPDGETGLFTFAALTAAPIILFAVLGVVFGPVISGLAMLFPRLGARRSVYRAALWKGVSLMSVLTVPLFVLSVFWSVGEAPALRWFAPVETARITATYIEDDNEGVSSRARVDVAAQGVAFPALTGSERVFASHDQARDYLAGLYDAEPLDVRVYRHRAYVQQIYPFDFAVIAATLVCLFIMLTGIIAIARSILTGR